MGDDTFVTTVINVCTMLIIALFGGVARVLTNHSGKISLSEFGKELIISGFAGLMISFIFPDPSPYKYFIVGMAGYTAPYTLKFLTKKFSSLISDKIEGEKA